MGLDGRRAKNPVKNSGKHRKIKRKHFGMASTRAKRNPSTSLPDKNEDFQNFSRRNLATESGSVSRKRIGPENVKYFSEIANLFAKSEIDFEERSIICNNAMEETTGYEFELSTDQIISCTLENLLEGCDLSRLCCFLHNCRKTFSLIATDKSGSHVLETAFKSLAVHLQNTENHTAIKEILIEICQVVTVKPANLMCNVYGSHVLRSLLCLCKGIPLDSLEEFHSTQTSKVLAYRLKTSFARKNGVIQHGFPDLLRFLVMEMLQNSKNNMSTLRVSIYGSLVLQVALRLLTGEDGDISWMIYIILGCSNENTKDGMPIEFVNLNELFRLLKDKAFSYLMEVVLEVSPELLYEDIFSSIFKGNLFKISKNDCGSYVIQALLSAARSRIQMDFVWEELGSRMKELLELGRSGVVVSLLAACQRLHLYENKACQSLSMAVESKSGSSIVPCLLFLDSYYSCEDKENWRWPNGEKTNIMGCLILQIIFKFTCGIIQPFVKSINLMETDQLIEIAKDASGSRVIESFLCSDVAAKHKHKVISKLKGCFGELSEHPTGSFIVEKCFAAGHLSQKATISSELVMLQPVLSKTKHGPYLIKRLDLHGFVQNPEKWKSMQASRQAAYQEFVTTFTSNPVHSMAKLPERTKIFVMDQQNGADQLPHECMSDVGSQKRKKKKLCDEAKSQEIKIGENCIPFISGKMKFGYGKKRNVDIGSKSHGKRRHGLIASS